MQIPVQEKQMTCYNLNANKAKVQSLESKLMINNNLNKNLHKSLTEPLIPINKIKLFNMKRI